MNRENPKISVRMPAYNHEKYVEQAVLSIINQSYQNFELIVIDDGSSDKTPEILERLSREYGFYFERQENMGVTGTLNKLMALAKGEFITGCASDDFWPNNRLELQLKGFDENPQVGMVYGLAGFVDSEGKPLERQNNLHQSIPSGCIYDQVVKRGVFFKPGTVMARRSVYDEVGLFDSSLKVEDFDWFLRATKEYEILAIRQVLHYYRLHGKNFVLTPSSRNVIFESERKLIKKRGFSWDSFKLLYYRVPYWFSLTKDQKSFWPYLFLFLTPLYLFKRDFLVQAYMFLFKKRARIYQEL